MVLGYLAVIGTTHSYVAITVWTTLNSLTVGDAKGNITGVRRYFII